MLTVINMIRAILVDDEPDNIKTLQLLLQRYCPEVEVTATYTDPKAALKALPKASYDLLLLDVEMPGMTGFELLKKLATPPPAMIFVTAHSHYAVRAFKFDAIDYLLKPVDIDDLRAALAKYKRTKADLTTDKVKQLLANIDHLSKPAVSRLALPTQDGVEMIALEEVIYLRADRNYTVIKREGRKDLIVARTLGSFEDLLTPPRFMRINKQYLISLDKITRYVRTTSLALMQDGTEIQVSRTRKEEFQNLIQV